MGMILHTHKEASCLQILYYRLSCLISVHAGICGVILNDMGILGHDVYNRQIMAAADLKVVGVMCGGDLHHARAEIHFNVFIGYNRYLPAHKGEYEHLANSILVALISGVYRNGSIT